ncbi:MAG: DUF5719 family protein [Actinomycetota bacterium]
MSRLHGRRSTHEPRRAGAIALFVVLVAFLVGLGAFRPDSGIGSTPPLAVDAVAASSASSSTFYCAGLREGLSSGIVVTNTTSAVVSGTMSLLGQHGLFRKQPIVVPPRTVLRFNVQVRTHHAWSTAMLQFNGGGVAVAEALAGERAWSTTPCASTVQDHWYFADGVTTLRTGSTLVLANPSVSTAAVVSTSFFTPDGVREPQAFQGVVVPPLSTVTLSLGRYVLHQAQFATEVSAISGRVVAAIVELGLVHSSVVTVVPGQVDLPGSSIIPYVVDEKGQVQQFALANFAEVSTEVRLSVVLPSGRLPSKVMSLPPRSLSSVPVSAFDGIPKGYPFSVSFSTKYPGRVLAARLDVAHSRGVEFRSVETARGLSTLRDRLFSAPVGLTNGRAILGPFGIQSLSDRQVTVTFSTIGAGTQQEHAYRSLVLGPHQFVSINGGIDTSGGTRGIVLESTGSVAMSSRAIPGGSAAEVGFVAVSLN